MDKTIQEYSKELQHFLHTKDVVSIEDLSLTFSLQREQVLEILKYMKSKNTIQYCDRMNIVWWGISR